MTNLQFVFNQILDESLKTAFRDEVQKYFVETTGINASRVVISIREYDKFNQANGRANVEADICLINLDMGFSGTIEQRHQMTLLCTEQVKTLFNIELSNQYITFTPHVAESLCLIEELLTGWSPEETCSAQL